MTRRRLRLTFATGESVSAEMLDDEAPEVCRVVWDLLPVEGKVLHGMYSGAEVFLLLDAAVSAPAGEPVPAPAAGRTAAVHGRLVVGRQLEETDRRNLLRVQPRGGAPRPGGGADARFVVRPGAGGLEVRLARVPGRVPQGPMGRAAGAADRTGVGRCPVGGAAGRTAAVRPLLAGDGAGLRDEPMAHYPGRQERPGRPRSDRPRHPPGTALHPIRLDLRPVQLDAQPRPVVDRRPSAAERQRLRQDVVRVEVRPDDVARVRLRRQTPASQPQVDHRRGADAEFQVRPDRDADPLPEREIGDGQRRAEAAGLADVHRHHVARPGPRQLLGVGERIHRLVGDDG